MRPAYERGRDPVTLVDMFCGCGGMTLGLARAAKLLNRAIDIRAAFDTDAAAMAVYKANFRPACFEKDPVEQLLDGRGKRRLTARERALGRRLGKSIDFLVGGPPCQGSSDLNNHTRRKDPRNKLYSLMSRAARVFGAKFVLIENVPAVIHDRSNVVDDTADVLRFFDYVVADATLDLAAVGVPQARRRHVLLACQKDTNVDPVAILSALGTARESIRTVRWAIEDLRDARNGSFDKASSASEMNKRRIAWLFHNREYDLPNRLRPPCHRLNEHSYKSIYGRLRWNRPAQTITTGFGSMGQGRYVHPSQRRTITPHEAARLQCFPDFFSFAAAPKRGVWGRLIGNAVPSFFVTRTALEILAMESAGRAGRL